MEPPPLCESATASVASLGQSSNLRSTFWRAYNNKNDRNKNYKSAIFYNPQIST